MNVFIRQRFAGVAAGASSFRGNTMHFPKYLMILPLALAAVGAAKADGYCNQRLTFDSGGPGGYDCKGIQRTRPVEEALESTGAGTVGKNAKGGSQVDGVIITLPPSDPEALPDYAEADLQPYYSKGQDDEIHFIVDTTDLDMVDVGEGAEVSLAQLDLQSLVSSETGKNDHCTLNMAVGADNVRAPTESHPYTLRFYWTCSYATTDPATGDTFTNVENMLTFTAVDPVFKKREVWIRPTDASWTRVVIDVETVKEPDVPSDEVLSFSNGLVLDVPSSTLDGGYTPVSLRTGIIAGSLWRSGMTMSYYLFWPPIGFPPHDWQLPVEVQ